MIEIDKMLHLRKYVLIVLRNNTKSRIARSLHSLRRDSTSLCEKGYVHRYVQYCYVPPARCDYIANELSRVNYAATCVRTYSTIVQSSVNDIDHKLKLLCDDVENGYVSVDRLRDIIKIYDESDYQLHLKTGILLLRCCGDVLPGVKQKERQNLTNQIWELMRNNHELTLEHYNTLLEVYAENIMSVDPKEFLANMKVQPDENTYYLLMNAIANTDNIEHVQDVISLMKENNISLNQDTYGALVQVYMANGNVTEAEKVIMLVKDANMPVDKLYTKLACGYAKLDDIPNLVKTLNDEPQNEEDLIEIIKTLSKAGHGRHIPVVLNYLMDSVPAIKSKIEKTIIEFIYGSRFTDAHTIINCLAMNEKTAEHAKSFANSFLDKMIMMNIPAQDIAKSASEFMDSGCDPMALTNIAEIGLKLGREQLCFAIFDAMQKKDMEIRPHYYWPLLVIAHREKSESKVLSLVKSMVDMGVEIDSMTLTFYVYPYINTTNVNIAVQRLLDMNLSQEIIFTPMVSFLLFQNRLQDAVHLCKNMYAKLYYKDLIKQLTDIYLFKRDAENCVALLMAHPMGSDYVGLFLSIILNNYPSNFRTENLKLLLKTMKEHGAKIIKQDLDIIKIKFEKINLTDDEYTQLSSMVDDLMDNKKKYSAIPLIPHPRYMNSKDLSCLLVELKGKNFDTRLTLQWLLRTYCNQNNLKKAQEIMQEFDEKGYDLMSSMQMNLFSLYVKHNKLKKARTLVYDINQLSDKIKISTILEYATALIKAQMPEEAFKIIDQYSKKFIINKYNNKLCCVLLDTLTHSSYNIHVKRMLNLLINRKYCTVSEVLKPLVAIPLEQNDLLNAVNVFEDCVKSYYKAPLAQDLLSALLREKENSNLKQEMESYIEKVFDLISELYGTLAANTYLAIALASLNKKKELQNLLEKHELSVNFLMNYSNYAQKNDKIDILWTIFETCPSKSSLDQVVLCDVLLSAYSKMSDYNSAIKLWEIMCTKNIKAEESFIRNFTQLLQLNKIPLPTELQTKDKISVSN